MKWLRWVAKLALSVLLITTISVYSTWVLVNTYIQDVLKNFQLNTVVSQVNFTDLVAQLVDSNRGSNLEMDPSRNYGDVSREDEALDVSTQPQSDEIIEDDEDHSLDSTTEPDFLEEAPEDSIPVMSNPIPSGEELAFSTQQLDEVKSQLTGEQKLQMFSILSKLPHDELMRISAVLEGGISTEDLKDLQETVKKHVKPEEYEQLISILQE